MATIKIPDYVTKTGDLFSGAPQTWCNDSGFHVMWAAGIKPAHTAAGFELSLVSLRRCTEPEKALCLLCSALLCSVFLYHWVLFAFSLVSHIITPALSFVWLLFPPSSHQKTQKESVCRVTNTPVLLLITCRWRQVDRCRGWRRWSQWTR